MKKSLTWLTVAAIATALLVGTTVVFAKSFEQSDAPLNELLLQQSDLPNGARFTDVGPIDADDSRNVLNSKSQVRTEAYREAFYAFAVSPVRAPDSQGQPTVGPVAVPVIQLAYRYETEAQALDQFKHLAGYWGQVPAATVLRDSGQSYEVRFVGSEGDAIYWFARVKGTALVLLCVDDLQAIGGTPSTASRTFFDGAVVTLSSK